MKSLLRSSRSLHLCSIKKLHWIISLRKTPVFESLFSWSFIILSKTPVTKSPSNLLLANVIFGSSRSQKSCSFIKKTPTQVFFCEYCENFKNIFFIEDLRWLLLHFITPKNTRKSLVSWHLQLVWNVNNGQRWVDKVTVLQPQSECNGISTHIKVLTIKIPVNFKMKSLSILVTWQASKASNLNTKDTPTKVFSLEFYEIF